MTSETEKQALALVNEVLCVKRDDLRQCSRDQFREALCRAIEQHEAFRQEVSDAVEVAKATYGGHREAFDQLEYLIIPNSDPLIEALKDKPFNTAEIEIIRAALAARGLKIVEVGHE